jgi:hypothetical protein
MSTPNWMRISMAYITGFLSSRLSPTAFHFHTLVQQRFHIEVLATESLQNIFSAHSGKWYNRESFSLKCLDIQGISYHGLHKIDISLQRPQSVGS